MLTYAILFAIGVSGCADPAYTLAIEREFTDEEVVMIEAAIEEWMWACDCEDAAVFLRYDLVDEDNVLTYDEWEKRDSFGRLWKMHTTDPAFIKEEQDRLKKNEGSFVGIHKAGNIGLVVDKFREEKYKDDFYNVLLHELGHLYGIKDHLESGIMMSGGYKSKVRESCIDWLALSKFCDMHNCGDAAEPTCH